MLRQTILTLFAGLPLFCAAADSAPVSEDARPECIEAVARVRVLAYRPRPLGSLGPDEIVMSWTWDVDVDVREVYLGNIPRGKLTIGATLHTEFNPELHQPVFFLTRKFGMWYVSYVAFAARSRAGGYVIPVYWPPDEDYLAPQGWLPHDYGRWLRPVSYRVSDVEGFSHTYEDEDRGAEWISVRGSHVIAKRGFSTGDIPAMLAERRAVECVSDAGGQAP